MHKHSAHRLLAAFASSLLLASGLSLPTIAHASHGIKCGWVLVSSVGGVNTYQYVCHRGV